MLILINLHVVLVYKIYQINKRTQVSLGINYQGFLEMWLWLFIKIFFYVEMY